MSFIYFVIVLGITILIHELGHFIFAKKANIYVYEFSIGMGPKIFSYKRKNDETIYSIRLFPIGGFVSMAGEDNSNNDRVSDDRKLYNKTWMQRFLTIIAGVAFNFILAIILLFCVGMIAGVSNNKPIIYSVDSNYPISLTNVSKGDLITAINNKKISSTDMLLLELQINYGKTITIDFKRGDKSFQVDAKPVLTKSNGSESYAYGFSLDNTKEYGFIAAFKYAFNKTISLIVQMFYILIYLITGKLSLNSLAGPVGMFSIVSTAASTGIINIIYLIAYLCINVGFINLIPFPAFDGGRVFFLMIEGIRKKKIKPEIENTINTIGFVFLMTFMIFITFQDIIRIFK
ncbi:MAG: M50 family metallopeptidase [Bacilli bacterium]